MVSVTERILSQHTEPLMRANRYPVILDAYIQSQGIGFVGTDRSTFSTLARLRVRDWNDGAVRMVKWGRPDADEH